MNTMIECTAEQDIDKTSVVLQTLLFLGRKFMGQTDVRIQQRHTRYSRQHMQHVPPRVWRRHSALLDMLMQQNEAEWEGHRDTE